MREIKFRVWTPDEGMAQVKYIDLDKIKDFQEFGHVLMQYSGLKDKNGKEIYEGDIVCNNEFGKLWAVPHEVIFDRYMFNVKDYYDQTADYPTVAFSEGVFEIIGNIHENPELLEGE